MSKTKHIGGVSQHSHIQSINFSPMPLSVSPYKTSFVNPAERHGFQ